METEQCGDCGGVEVEESIRGINGNGKNTIKNELLKKSQRERYFICLQRSNKNANWLININNRSQRMLVCYPKTMERK